MQAASPSVNPVIDIGPRNFTAATSGSAVSISIDTSGRNYARGSSGVGVSRSPGAPARISDARIHRKAPDWSTLRGGAYRFSKRHCSPRTPLSSRSSPSSSSSTSSSTFSSPCTSEIAGRKVRERGRPLNDRATGRIDETRPNIRMHSRGCIWLHMHACFDIGFATRLMSEPRVGTFSNRGRRRRRLWVIDIADLARCARARTLMDMQKCKKRFPRQRGRGCLAGDRVALAWAN